MGLATWTRILTVIVMARAFVIFMTLSELSGETLTPNAIVVAAWGGIDGLDPTLNFFLGLVLNTLLGFSVAFIIRSFIPTLPGDGA